ncbi:GNAT family N-acetyltransferase [Kurthia senegalensis]|uniref:GNAT family N-acetyltransferase n=1 Tax=Kurthia senegalensis TaxID=1033740 RepID=UPI000289C4F9|nr:GNAT family N-acetyltransferase [Kurthia senegalensis]
MTLTYRIATLADLERIVAIYNTTIASRMVTADLEEVSVEERTPWFHAHDPKRRPLWVIEQQNEIVGWISLQDFYGRIAYQKTAEVSIYLAPETRGKGIGKQAIAFVLEQSPNYQIETLLGFIFGHNLPSLHLFKHFNFEQWASLPGVAELDGVKRDLIILGKKL